MEWNAPIHCQMQHWSLLYAPNYTEMPSTKLPAYGVLYHTVALLLFIEFLGVFVLDMGQGLSGTPLVHKFFRSPLFLPSVKIKKSAQTHCSSDYVGKAKMKLQYRTEKNQPAKQNVFHSCPPQNLIHRTKVQKLGEKVL